MTVESRRRSYCKERICVCAGDADTMLLLTAKFALTIPGTALKFQSDRSCFQRGEASANFSVTRICQSVYLSVGRFVLFGRTDAAPFSGDLRRNDVIRTKAVAARQAAAAATIDDVKQRQDPPSAESCFIRPPLGAHRLARSCDMRGSRTLREFTPKDNAALRAIS